MTMNVHRGAVSAALFVALGAVASAQSLHVDFSPSVLKAISRRIERQQMTIECGRCKAAPKIDGSLDDAAWRTAAKIEKLSRPRPATTARICYDDVALYVAAICEEEPGRAPQGGPRPRDGAAWKDDCIEIWFNPLARDALRYQFVISVAGAVFDCQIRGGGHDAAYNPEWSHAVRRERGRWTLEVAIPLKALGLRRWYRRLAFNIGRNGPGLGTRSWNPRYGDTSGSSLIMQGASERAAVAAEEQFVSSRDLAVEGKSLRVRVARTYARPGDRYVMADLAFRPTDVPLARTRLDVKIFRLAGSEPVEAVSVVPERREAKLYVDLRRHGLRRAELSLAFYEGDKRTGAAQVLLSARACDRPLKPGQKIAVRIDVPEGAGRLGQWPVTFGVPFPEGALWDVGLLRLVDGQGQEIPHQKEVTGRWSRDGAIKWVRFDALVASDKGCFVQVARPGQGARPAMPVRVRQRDDQVVVDTGVARYVLGKGASPIREIWLEGKRVATSSGTRGLYVIDQKGRVASASADGETMRVEASGPVASCVRFEGFYRTADRVQLARHITRVECRAGQAFADVTHTLILTNDTNEVWFKEIGWEFAVGQAFLPAGRTGGVRRGRQTGMSGPRCEALFGSAADQHDKHVSCVLNAATPSAYMLQDSHYHFAHGKNHFLVATVARDGKSRTRLEGEECGDWALLAGRSLGLELCCRNAARQHPKEFEVFQNRMVLKLFSGRAGEQLDFRTPTLIRKWDLPTWTKKAGTAVHKKTGFIERLRAYKTNAIGWAKTHQILINPVGPDNAAQVAARASKLHRTPVYAHPDPWWIYQTRAMGPLYPRDRKRFPEVEKAVDAAFRWWLNTDRDWGEFGFVDYFAGPHLSYRGKYVHMFRYAYITYTLRANIWLVYARSGDRAIREFAAGTTRTYMDGVHAHWEPPQSKRSGIVKGLYRAEHTYFGLPFYWGSRANLEISSSTNFNNYIWLYQLTGYRRAKDCIEEYAQGIKTVWTPAAAKRTSRILALQRLLTQCYGFTWDPDLYDLADATTDLFEDREGELLLTKDRPYNSSSYKTQVDIRCLINAWEILGAPRYRDMAMTIARHWWNRQLGTSGFGYNIPMALIGNFLYHQTGDPVYAQAVAVSARHCISQYDPETNTFAPRTIQGAHSTSFIFEIGNALDVIARTNADKGNVASWIGYDDADSETSVLVQKPCYGVARLHYKAPSPRTPGAMGGVRVEPVKPKDHWGQDVSRVTQVSTGQGEIRIPKDAPPGAYRVIFPQRGTHYVFANDRLPLVLHAPGYWLPSPVQAPVQRYYFRVPEGGKDCQIFFEGSARLTDPAGQPFRKGQALSGWVNLPAKNGGLWAFEPVDNMTVRVRNVPPFFAVGDPASYFMPDIEWKREPIPPAPTELSPDTVYVPGAISTPGNKAVYLAARRYLEIKAGPPHPSGDGNVFLPHRQGTVEFFMKPNWDTVAMPDGEEKSLFYGRMQTPGGSNYYTVHHTKKGRAKDLFAFVRVKTRTGSTTNRNYRRQTLFFRDRWVHVAWVWGKRSAIFVNGRLGSQQAPRLSGPPLGGMSSFVLGHTRAERNIDAAIDEFRISDIERYTADFAPPPRDREFVLDEHTRALFHFNGNVDGESHAQAGPVPARLTKR